MANRIKGITVEINGETTGLDKALKNVNTTIKDTQSKLKTEKGNDAAEEDSTGGTVRVATQEDFDRFLK